MPYLRFYDHIDPGQGGSAMVIPEVPRTILDEPTVFICPICSLSFDSYDDRFQHRFESHPYKRPLLIIGPTEVNSPRFIITSAVSEKEIKIVNAATCRLDEKTVSVSALIHQIANAVTGFFRIQLIGSDGKITVEYEISVEIVSKIDAMHVEQEFARLYAPGVISLTSINGFIRATANASSANRYVEGLTSYLYGILAKDQRGGATLTQEQSRERLNDAVQTLSEINRPLAAAVAGIINFQSNAFMHYERLAIVPRLFTAMRWFDSVKTTGNITPFEREHELTAPNSQVPLDSVTDEILGWFDLRTDRVSEAVGQMTKRSRQDTWHPEDRIKSAVLLAAVHHTQGDRKSAAQIARGFRHDPVFDKLAENLISSH